MNKIKKQSNNLPTTPANVELTVGECVEVAAVEVVKSVAKGVPVIGTFVSVVEGLKNNAWKKRREKWEALVEQEIASLKTSIEELSDNESFATMIVKTTELAMKTSKDEKLKYLANALKNSIVVTLDEDKLIIFMALIEKYSSSHIELLEFYGEINTKKINHRRAAEAAYKATQFRKNSTVIMSTTSGDYKTPSAIFKKEYQGNNQALKSLFDKCYNDLFNDGLLNTSETKIMGNSFVHLTTELGEEFLKFLGE